MTRHLWLVALIVLGLAQTNIQGVEPQQSPAKAQELAKAKLEAARATFDSLWSEKIYSNVEFPYRWSVRWLEAQLLLSDKSEDHRTAFQAHVDRMKELEMETKAQYQKRITTVDQVTATRYYVAEAEAWLHQGKR
jgi:hypothetical protein